MNAVVASNPLPARGHDVGETAVPLPTDPWCTHLLDLLAATGGTAGDERPSRPLARPSAQCPHAYATQRRSETTLDAHIGASGSNITQSPAASR